MKSVIDQEHFNIMKKVCYKNLSSVCDSEEMDSLIYFTYAKCLKYYDPNKSTAKFTSYIHQSVDYNSRKLYLKTVRAKERYIPTSSLDTANESQGNELADILDALKYVDVEMYDILIKKFIYNMTNVEIGNINGYSREAARKKVEKAINMCRDIVYN